MSKILAEIKGEFDEHISLFGHNSACERNPFGMKNHWMYYYLFPEVLMVAEDHCEETFGITNSTVRSGDILVFPCWVMPESEVLRIMAEHGLL